MKALITGIRGQDGSYLAKLLLEKGYEVYGADRRNSENSWRLKKLGIEDKVNIVYMDLHEYSNIQDVIRKGQFDEVYNLGAQTFVAVSFEQPILTGDVNALGVTRLLEAIRRFSPHSKFYQASTSEMFGEVQEIPQTEKTPFYPKSPYATAKLYAYWITKNYRESFGLKTYNGILFNHESPLRGIEFVTRKITHSVKNGKKVTLGNLDAKRDWGYAPDFVEAMWLMLQNEPDDYLIATGESHTIREFVEETYRQKGKEVKWEGSGVNEVGIVDGLVMVDVSEKFYRPNEVGFLLGNPQKAKEKLGWVPKTKFKDLVRIMYENEDIV